MLEKRALALLDVTGGAPEMNPGFRYLVEAARTPGVEVMDRCNLTILMESGYLELHEFLAENRVQITGSLPCYGSENVAEQRGKGVFEASIAAMLTVYRWRIPYCPATRKAAFAFPAGGFRAPGSGHCHWGA